LIADLAWATLDSQAGQRLTVVRCATCPRRCRLYWRWS